MNATPESLDTRPDAGDLHRQVLQLAYDRLQSSPYRELRTVRCDFAQGVLTLRGRLPLFFHKQLAQQAVAAMQQVQRVENRIEVGSSLT